MTQEQYRKATPFIKELELLESQINALKTATNIKVDVAGVSIGFSLATVREIGMTEVRGALVRVLSLVKEDKLKELESI